MSHIQHLIGFSPDLTDFQAINAYYRKDHDMHMIEDIGKKYELYRPHINAVVDKYINESMNGDIKTWHIVDSHTPANDQNMNYVNKVTSAIFILIGKDNSRALCYKADPASLGIVLPYPKARRNAVIGGLNYYQAFTYEQGAFLEEWMKYIVISSEVDTSSGNTIYPSHGRYPQVGKKTIYAILDNDQKSFNAYLNPYWRHTHTFGYEFNTDKCYIYVGNSQIIQMRADVDSYICDFARTIELTCKLNGVKLLSHYRMFPKNGKPFVCGIAEDKFGKRGYVKLILKHYRFDVFIDGDMYFEYNRSHLSLDEWTLYGRGFSQYPGYYPSSQIAYHDFDGDEVNYIFNGISFKIKPTGFDFYFKPAYKSSMLVPYGELYKGVDYSDIQPKDIYDKNPSIKHIRKIKK